jgi:hypothetical protein
VLAGLTRPPAKNFVAPACASPLGPGSARRQPPRPPLPLVVAVRASLGARPDRQKHSLRPRAFAPEGLAVRDAPPPPLPSPLVAPGRASHRVRPAGKKLRRFCARRPSRAWHRTVPYYLASPPHARCQAGFASNKTRRLKEVLAMRRRLSRAWLFQYYNLYFQFYLHLPFTVVVSKI